MGPRRPKSPNRSHISIPPSSHDPTYFQVAWVKSDSKTIQAIHDAVITHNRRVSISGDLSTTFNLLIAQVEEKDRGEYMCQINTDPMTYQSGHIPFKIISAYDILRPEAREFGK